jgi:adenosylmethionine-8-amino-7-oxononanoate aminotransferase
MVRALPGGDIVALTPPLMISAEEVEQIVARTGRALDAAAAKLRADGVFQD